MPPFLSTKLTPFNSQLLGFEWQQDFLQLDQLSTADRKEVEDHIYVFGVSLGEPQNQDSQHVGFYIPILPELEVDYTLMPENCEERGYEWVGDVMYDTDQPYIVAKDTIDLVQQDGYKLGAAASSNEDFQGLYAPPGDEA